MEEIEISHYVPDSSGEDLAYARTYFFGHPDCVRKFYRTLVDHKLDLFKHIPERGIAARRVALSADLRSCARSVAG